jgi:adenylyl cyclase-associated protein
MTHKNPDLRSSSVAPDATKSGPPAVKAKPGALTQAANKPPKMELQDGNKWIVVGRLWPYRPPSLWRQCRGFGFLDQLMRYPSQEYQENNKNISIDDTQLNQVVQIYGCNNSVIKVSGKINAITMGEW